MKNVNPPNSGEFGYGSIWIFGTAEMEKKENAAPALIEKNSEAFLNAANPRINRSRGEERHHRTTPLWSFVILQL